MHPTALHLAWQAPSLKPDGALLIQQIGTGQKGDAVIVNFPIPDAAMSILQSKNTPRFGFTHVHGHCFTIRAVGCQMYDAGHAPSPSSARTVSRRSGWLK